MLKQTVTYTDWNDQQQTEDLYFNISKTELTGNLHMIETLENLKKTIEGPQRELTLTEVQSIVDLVRFFMKLSYGVRSEDGKRFKKNDDIWQEFTETAAYDAFTYSLFEQPEKAVQFLLGVLPADLRDKAQGEMPGQMKLDVPTTAPALKGALGQDVISEPVSPEVERIVQERLAAQRQQQS